MQPRIICIYQAPVDPKLSNNFLHRNQGRANKPLLYVIIWFMNYLVLSTYQIIRLSLEAQCSPNSSPHFIITILTPTEAIFLYKLAI